MFLDKSMTFPPGWLAWERCLGSGSEKAGGEALGQTKGVGSAGASG